MTSTRFNAVLFRELQEVEQEGNYNLFIQKAVHHFQELRPVWEEIISRFDFILDKFLTILSPTTILVLKSIPENLPGVSGSKSLSQVLPRPPEGDFIGKIAFPVITSKGLVRELQVSEKGAHDPNPVSSGLLDLVGSGLFAGLRRKTRRFLFWDPERFSFRIMDPRGQEVPRVEGESLGLPLALALYSKITGTPIPTDFSATGGITREGSVSPVSALSLKEKLQAFKRERYYINQVIVSEKQEFPRLFKGLKIIRVARVEEAVQNVFPGKINLSLLPVAIDLEAEINKIKIHYKGHLWDTCIENAGELIAYLKSPQCPMKRRDIPPQLFVCYWRRGSSYCHQGNPKMAQKDLNRAERLYVKDRGLIPVSDYLGGLNNYAVALKDVFRYSEAIIIHEKIRKIQEEVMAREYDRGKNLSSLSQLYLALGQFEEAEKLQKEAIRLVGGESRNYGYLAQIYIRQNSFTQAQKTIARLRKLLDLDRPETRERNEPYYRSFLAEYLYRRGKANTKKSADYFQRLHHLVEDSPLNHYASGLVYKYSALALLHQGEATIGLARLARAINFFDSSPDLMFKLIGAAIKTEKVHYLLKQGELEQAKKDLSTIIGTLSNSGVIRTHFKPEIRQLSYFLKSKTPDQGRVANLQEAINSILQKIPY